MRHHVVTSSTQVQTVEEFAGAGADWSVLDECNSQQQRRCVQQVYGINDMPEGQPSLLKMAATVLAYPPHIIQVSSTQSSQST